MRNNVVGKGLAILVIILFIGMVFTPSTASKIEQSSISTLGGDILYVGGDGPGNYTSIQAAINDANPGDTVFVYNGTYYEIVDIYKSIFLIGEDRNTTIIQANESDYCVRITANEVNITGFTIKRIGYIYNSHGAVSISSANNVIWGNNIFDTNSSGVYIRDPLHHNMICYNQITGAGFAGIDSYFSSYNNIIGNNISGFYRGVKFGEGSNNIISENYFENNRVGVFLLDSYNSVITGNVFLNNLEYGVWLMRSYYDSIINNAINDSNIGIMFGGTVLTNVSDNVITDSDTGGIWILSASYAKFYRNNLTNNRIDDLQIQDADNLTIEHNYISRGITFGSFVDKLENWNTHTIRNNFAHNGPIRYYKNVNNVVVPSEAAQVILANCSNFTIQHLNLSYVWRGIQLGYSSHNLIAENTYHGGNVNPHNDHGMELWYSERNIIFNNYIYDTSCAINLVRSCEKNVISRNIFFDDGSGLLIYDSCFDNFIVWNDFIDNYDGILIYDQCCSSNNNVIHHNNFINSYNQHAFNYGDNIWDDGYPSGGNYWDDYSGADNNGDGIGDTPYNITGWYGEVTGQDRYPLMESVNIDNAPPIVINISGPLYGMPGIEYVFCVEVVDPEGDAIFCKWDWGDGTISEWVGPGYSWETICSSHTWYEEGTYNIKVKLKDVHGSESNWTNPFMIIIEAGSPKVQITKPHRGIYINNHKILPRLFRMCLVIGDIDISVNASDDISGIERVEFYIDRKLQSTDTSAPYTFRWKRDRLRLFVHCHIIKVNAFDNAGNRANDIIIARKFF